MGTYLRTAAQTGISYEGLTVISQAAGGGEAPFRALDSGSVLAMANRAPVALTDEAGTILFASDAFAGAAGYPSTELVGRALATLATAESAPALRDGWTVADREGRWIGEIAGRSADGSAYWVEVVVEPVSGGTGAPLRCLVTFTDVTDRRRLRETERRNRDLHQLAPDGFFVTVGEIIADVNDVAVTLLRAGSSAELVGRSMVELFHPDCRERLRSRIATLMEGPAQAPMREEVLLALDGTEIPVEVRTVSHYVEGRLCILATCRDLSAHKAVERQLREERDFSNTALNGMPAIFYHFADDGRFLRWNTRFEQATGYTADELAEMHALDSFDESDHALITGRITEV